MPFPVESSSNQEDKNESVWKPGFKDRFCYDCDSTKNPNCVDNARAIAMRTCPMLDEEHLGCYHKIEGNINQITQSNLEARGFVPASSENRVIQYY